MLVHGLTRDSLRDIPCLNDAITFEAEDVNDSKTQITGSLSNARKNRDLVAVLECALHFQYFVRALGCVRLHSILQRYCITTEVGIVVTKAWADVLRVRFVNPARSDQS